MPKRILLLTFFYPPDLSAGSFRAQALVAALRAHAGEAVEIDVFTTQPNRYQEHASETLSFESEDGVRIRRIRLPLHRGGLRGQAVSFVAFGYQAARHLRSERYDLVIATSSRLMTAVLGAWIAYRQRARLYLDVRDIFVENLGDLFPVPVAKPFIRTFDALERWVIRRADKVNLISPGFLGYFQPRYPGRCYSLHSNGVDEAFSCFPEHELHRNKSSRPLQVLYAGNVGDGQALHLIIPKIAGRLGSSIHFRVIGGAVDSRLYGWLFRLLGWITLS